MVSESPEEARAGAGNRSPDIPPNSGEMDGGGAGIRPLGENVAREGVEGNHGANPPGPDVPPADRAPGVGDQPASPRDPEAPRREVPSSERTAGNKRYTKTEIAVALRESEGNIKLAAAALDCSEHNIRWWITNDTELNALWGGATPKSAPVTAPSEGELMDREPDTQPAGIPSPDAVNLALGIGEQDAKILLKGLKELGLSEATLTRLKKLDDLAQSNGHFLSVSLQTTHRMYFVQLVEMMEMAQKMKTDYIDFEGTDPADPAKKFTRLSIEERAWFYKCYTEMVKEAGKGYTTMMEGTKAMVMMLKAAAGDGDKPKSAKPKWHSREAAAKPVKKK